MPAYLPYGRQHVVDADVDAVVRVLVGDWLTTGPAVEEFERNFAVAVGAEQAVACASGTAALHIAAIAAGMGPGDIALVPSITFAATANAVRLTGAEIELVDVDPETALIRLEDVEAALLRMPAARRNRVRAILPVHMAGQPVDLAALSDLADTIGASIIEDACHAIGTISADGPVGSCARSAMATFSFHPVKTIAAGEGGMVTTGSSELARQLRRARNHGMSRDPRDFTDSDIAFSADGTPNPWYYEIDEPRPNYRLSDIHSALANSQLRRLPDLIERRQALRATYEEVLAPLAPRVRISPNRQVGSGRSGQTISWHLCVALVDFAEAGVDRATVMRELIAREIGTQVHYIPLHLQPGYRERYRPEQFPGAAAWYRQALSLPLFAQMQDNDVRRVVAALSEVLGITSASAGR